MVVKAPITAKTFEHVADSLGPCELVRGEIVTLMPGGLLHSAISNAVAHLLTTWAKKSRRGRVFSNEAGLVTDREPDTVRGIDVAYFSFRRLPRGREPEGFTDIPPELAVEIVGKGQGWPEMFKKASEYLSAGVDRVWIIDPKKRSVHILRSDAEPEVLRNSAVVRDAKVLPGFRCRVVDFFD